MEIRMIFRDIELSDRDWLDKKFREDNKKACEFCFANNYLWRKYFPTQIATEGDCVILRYYAENDAMYVFPIGNGDKKKALEQLFLYGQAKGEQIHLYGLLDYEVEQLKEWYPRLTGICLIISTRQSILQISQERNFMGREIILRDLWMMMTGNMKSLTVKIYMNV